MSDQERERESSQSNYECGDIKGHFVKLFLGQLILSVRRALSYVFRFFELGFLA